MSSKPIAEDEPLRLRVRTERRRRGWTQRQAAERAAISFRAYQDFEGGKRTPQPENLRTILRAFEMTAAEGVADEQAGDETREATVEGWPLDIRIFLDMMGALLATMDEATRERFMHDLTRKLVTRDVEMSTAGD